MAEQTVEIENFGEGGVASEATLKLLLKAMDNLAKGQAGEAKKSKDAVKKYHDEMKSGVKVFKENRDALEEHTDALDEASESASRFSRGALGLAITGMSSLAGSAFNLGKELLVGGSNFADFAQHVPIVGSHLAGLVSIIDDSVNNFREMTAVGVDFGGSIIELRNAAAQSGLSMDAFQRIVTENSENLAIFAGSASEGARRFRDISGIVQKNFAGPLLNLGIGFEELGEFTADYLTLQTRMGRAQQMNDQQLAAGSAAYIQQLDRLSKLTGKRRDQVAEELNAQQNDRRLQALMASMTEDASKALQNVTVGIQDSDLQEAITELVATGGVPLENELAKSIARMNPALAEASRLLRDGNISEEEYFAVLNDAIAQSKEELRTNGKNIATYAALGNTAFDATLVLGKMGEVGANFAEVTDEQREAMENGERSLLGFGQALQNFRNEIIGRFIETGAFQMLEAQISRLTDWMRSPDGLAAIEKVVGKFTDWLGGLINDFQEQGIWKTITERVGGAISDMMGGLVTKIGIAIVGLFAGPALISAVSGGITSALGGMFSGGGGKDGGGSRSRRGGGNAGASMGRNVGGLMGGLAGGVMEGAAAGLKAFGTGSGKILLGAATVAGVMTAISAGIGASAFILGATLPGFIDGIKKFEELDGTALVDAGKGMLAISGAMAAFGAGSAVAGVGALVGGITQGIVSLFGGEDPMEKLQRFASYDIDADRVENNARAMTAFSRAMAAQGAGAAVSGIGNAVGAIGDAIAGFFGRDTPLEQVKEFGDADINAEGVENNATAMASMANALSAFGGGEFGDAEIPKAFVNRLEEIAAITGTGLSTTAAGLQALASVSGLTEMVTSLNSLDAAGLTSYTNAMETLVDALEDLNTALSETNEGGLFGGGTGVGAADVLGQINTSSAGSSQQLTQLNNTMMQVLEVLREQYDVQEETARGTRRLSGNLIAGM